MSDLPRSPKPIARAGGVLSQVGIGNDEQGHIRKLLALADQLNKKAIELKPQDVVALPRRRRR
jgi:hypothetical protein